MKCDCCGKEINMKRLSTFRFTNGFKEDGWCLCFECGGDVNRHLKKVRKKLIR